MKPSRRRLFLAAAAGALGLALGLSSWAAKHTLRAKQDFVEAIHILHETGARPHFSPDGKMFVFDRRNKDGNYDVYLSDLNGNVIRTITDGRKGIGQRNNGNACFDHSGRFVIFISEVEKHFANRAKGIGDPGIGLYSNLWASNLEATQFWQLTNARAKRNLFDRVPSMATVNPVFSLDGKTLLWTERYQERKGNKWGMWRIKSADFLVQKDGQPTLRNERVFVTPPKGNYITAMGFVDSNRLVVAGNLDGQDEYGMDQYLYDLRSKRFTNLTRSPEFWDEDSCIAPSGRIVYMTNRDSRYRFNPKKRNWHKQPVEREYYSMDTSGGNRTRITFLNEERSPENLNNRVLVAACDISPNGRQLLGTIGVDHGKGNQRENVELKVVLLDFKHPL